MELLEKVMYGSLLNVLWVFGSFIGIGILGIGPASYAVAKTINKKELFVDQNPLLPIVREYFKQYKRCFLKTNIVTISFFMIISILSLNYFIVRQNDFMLALFSIPIFLLIIYGVICFTSSLSVSIHTEGNVRRKIKLTLLLPILVPSIGSFNLLLLILMGLLTLIAPAGFILLYGVMYIFSISVMNVQRMKKTGIIR
jgi:uncharacterized membrane protein YesL